MPHRMVGVLNRAVLQLDGILELLQRDIARHLSDTEAHAWVALTIRATQLNNEIGRALADPNEVDPDELEIAVLGSVAAAAYRAQRR